MPELSRFYGIVIRMYFRDHGPPHFHALYGGQQVLIDISSLSVLRGRLSPSTQGLVLEWATIHQSELIEAWERAQRLEDPGRIAPLE